MVQTTNQTDTNHTPSFIHQNFAVMDFITSVSDRDALSICQKYWFPKEYYAQPRSKKVWERLIKEDGFIVWSKTLGTISPGKHAGAIQLGAFASEADNADQEVKEHLQRLKILLPTVVDIVTSLLSFNPIQYEGVPAELQEIRAKEGKIAQSDLDLLRLIWTIKYTDDDLTATGYNGAMWPKHMVAGGWLSNKTVSDICQEAAWLMEELTGRHQSNFSFRDLAFLLGGITAVPPQVLSRMYVQKLEARAHRKQLDDGRTGNYFGPLIYRGRSSRARSVIGGGILVPGPTDQVPIRRKRDAAAPVSPAKPALDEPLDPLSNSEIHSSHDELNDVLNQDLDDFWAIEQRSPPTRATTLLHVSDTSSTASSSSSTSRSPSPEVLDCIEVARSPRPSSSSSTAGVCETAKNRSLSTPTHRGTAVVRNIVTGKVKKQRTRSKSKSSVKRNVEKFFIL